MSPEERFWKSLDKSGDCWLWTKSVRPNGYGQVNLYGRILQTHRAAFEMVNGTIPHNMCICHRCDVRLCCNPTHLFLGTRGENNRDMFAKKRGHILDGSHIIGIKNRNAKLTPEIAMQIVHERQGGESLASLARRYSVTRQAVWHVVHGRTWSEATGITNGMNVV